MNLQLDLEMVMVSNQLPNLLPVAAPRTIKPVAKPRPIKLKDLPVAALRTKITPLQQALKGSVKSYQEDITFDKDPLAQLNNTAQFI